MTDSATESTGDTVQNHTPTPNGTGSIRPLRRRELLKDAACILLSTLIYCISFHYFVSPCLFAPGGVGGIVAIVRFAFHLTTTKVAGIDPSPFLFFLINLPLCAVAKRQLGWGFVLKTLLTAFLMTVMMFVLDNYIDPEYVYSIGGTMTVTDLGMRLISAIFGGICCGLSLYFALLINASTGGADVIAAMLQKKNAHRSIPAMVFSVNAVIALVSALIYRDNLMPIFLSLIYMYVSSKTCDSLMCGVKSALKFEVVTDDGEALASDIIRELGHSATVTPATGMFEHRSRSLLVCVIPSRQITRFKKILARYPNSFAYIGTVNEIIGKFNHVSRK